MRVALVLLALLLSGCSLIPVLLLTPDGEPRPTPALGGARVPYFAPPGQVDSTLQDIDVRWGGIDRLSVTLASGERLHLRPDTAGVRVRGGILVVRAHRRDASLPLATVSRFVARDRPSLLESLGLAATVAVGGAFVGGLAGAGTENAGWHSIRRGATIGAAVGAGVGAVASTVDRNFYDVRVAGFETP